MKYTTKDINILEYLSQLNLKLNLIEVKGTSVQELFYAMAIVQAMANGIEEVEEENKTTEKEA